eukprot:22298-Lingulodinium_polyedra.AAC.1
MESVAISTLAPPQNECLLHGSRAGRPARRAARRRPPPGYGALPPMGSRPASISPQAVEPRVEDRGK